MIPLATQLDTLDFDALVEFARNRLPAIAPEWTDYNLHDPGIMLVELLAWVADSQIYSLARNRHDEKLATARLLGIDGAGAAPASGLLFPLAAPAAANRIEADSRAVPTRGQAPRVEVATPIDLLPVEIDRIVVRAPGGDRDVTRINARQLATFAPFGDGRGELRIRLKAAPGAAWPEEPVLLSLGFRVDGDQRPAPDLGGVSFALGAAPLVPSFDSSRGLQRSGAAVLPIEACLLPRLLADELVVRPTAGSVLAPRLLEVAANAIPVRQQASFKIDDSRGTGRPGQRVIVDPRACFPDEEAGPERVWRLTGRTKAAGGVPVPGLEVQVSRAGTFEHWRCGDLMHAGPESRVFAASERADGSEVVLRFGNGVNGVRPALAETILLRLRLSCGAAGNIASRLEWLVDPVEIRACNRDPIAGGFDPSDADQALQQAAARLRDRRLLATSAQLHEAARALPGCFDVERVEVEEGWERGRPAPASPLTRSLIVSRGHDSAPSAGWLRAIERRLRPRIALGERLRVVAPVYRPFQIRYDAAFENGVRPADVRRAIAEMLDRRFALTATRGTVWPMGRDVDTTAVAGWISRVEGVARVRSAELVVAGAARDRLRIGRGELPRFVGAAGVGAQP